VGGFKIDTAPDRASFGTRWIGNINAVLVKNVFSVRNQVRRFDRGTLSEATRVNLGMCSRTLVEFIKPFQRSQPKNRLYVREAASIGARKSIQWPNTLPKIFRQVMIGDDGSRGANRISPPGESFRTDQ